MSEVIDAKIQDIMSAAGLPERGLWLARHAQTLRDRIKGPAWEPENMKSDLLLELINAGWLRRCAMRFGFEAFDTGVKWTDPALLFFSLSPKSGGGA